MEERAIVKALVPLGALSQSARGVVAAGEQKAYGRYSRQQNEVEAWRHVHYPRLFTVIIFLQTAESTKHPYFIGDIYSKSTK